MAILLVKVSGRHPATGAASGTPAGLIFCLFKAYRLLYFVSVQSLCGCKWGILTGHLPVIAAQKCDREGEKSQNSHYPRVLYWF